MRAGRTWMSGLSGVVCCAGVASAWAGEALPPLLGAAETAPAAELPPLSGARDRGLLLARMAGEAPAPQFCFIANPTPEQLANMHREFAMLPPGLLYANGGQAPRFFVGDAWNDNGFGGLTTGSTGQATPVALTYSFPGDGVNWDGGNNALTATLQARFGVASIDEGREYIRQALASWRRHTALTYTEVEDDGQPFQFGTLRSSLRGDIRIGARPLGTGSGVLAYNYFPSNGGDMVINTSFFPSSNVAGTFGDLNNSFRFLRNVIAHEHGHGLGFAHSCPQVGTKLMEPAINVGFDGLTLDEIRAGQNSYGDRFAGNINGTVSRDLGNLTSPNVRSFAQANLSTNGSGTLAGEDWFRFTISSAQPVVITVSPAGGTYNNGQQNANGSCSAGSPVNASAAGNLNVELRTGTNGGTVVQTASSAAAGATETLNAGTLAPGTYWIRVVDVGPNDIANQLVQLYSLLVRVGTSRAAPVAIAGLSKRCAANTNCFFMGDLNSYTTDVASGGNFITAYEWDLDGDGVFEIANSARTNRQYVSNGSHTVTLRVTDANGNKATDSINVVVFGAFTAVTGVSPNFSTTSATVPVVISGRNFKGVTSAAQISVSGSGITVNGNPVVNPLGTQITGLSFIISGTAPQTARSITVTNADGLGGTATLVNAFSVVSVGGACCLNSFCSISNQATCEQDEGVYSGDGTTCSPNPCGPVNGTCCASDGTCTFVTQASCTGAWTTGGACSPNPCPQPQGTCCATDGTCTFVTQASCTGAWTTGGACSPNPCPQPQGTCCATDGTCTVVTQASCTGAWTTGGACSPNPCPQPQGTCCATDGTCTFVTQASCTGAWTTGGACSPNPCPQPQGSCCSGATCAVTTQAACSGPNTRWSATAPVCNAGGDFRTPCCKADFDQNTAVSIDDIFIFLNGWFANSPQAAIGSNGGALTIDDIFIFLNAWFAGCP